VQLEDHVERVELVRHRLRDLEDACGAHRRQRLRERRRAVLVDLALHRGRLLFQIGGRGALRRDQAEVAHEEDENQQARHECELSRLRETGETGAHEAPFPLRMFATIVKLMTFWLATVVDWLLLSW